MAFLLFVKHSLNAATHSIYHVVAHHTFAQTFIPIELLLFQCIKGIL